MPGTAGLDRVLDADAYTFPRAARLLLPRQFSAVFEKRTVKRGRFFHLHAGGVRATKEMPAPPGAEPPRLGLVVGKKLLKTAVHRNLLKRLGREAFRLRRRQLQQRDYILRLAVKLDGRQLTRMKAVLSRDIASLLALFVAQDGPFGAGKP